MSPKKSYARDYVIGAETSVILVVLLLFAVGIISISGATSSCCVGRYTNSVNAGFNVGGNASYYVGSVLAYIIIIDPWVVDLIKNQDLENETTFVEYMDAHYPNATMRYFGMFPLYFADARVIADYGYTNMSLDGKSRTICLSAVFMIPFMEMVVNYENGTEYDSIMFDLFDADTIGNISLSDMVNATYNLPLTNLYNCGEVMTVEIMSMTAVDIAGGTNVTVVIDGVQHEMDGYD